MEKITRNKRYILEDAMADEITEDLDKCGYFIQIKSFKNRLNPLVDKKIDSMWKVSEKKNEEKIICYLSGYSKKNRCDYAVLESVKYADMFAKEKELHKYSCEAFANNLIPLKSSVDVITADGITFFGYSSYIEEKFIEGGKVNIYKHLESLVPGKIIRIIRTGQNYYNKAYINNFLVYVNISAEELEYGNKNFRKYAQGSEEGYPEIKIIKTDAKAEEGSAIEMVKKMEIFKWGLVGNRNIGKYSVAPQMWKELFSHLNYPVNYFVLAEEYADTLEKNMKKIMDDEAFIGCNIAMPWKTKAFLLCDDVDDYVKPFKTVNTMISDTGVVKGYNTDGMGMVNSLKKYLELENKKILVMGAGGACQTLPAHLLENKIKSLHICDISNEKAEHLTKIYSKIYEQKNLQITAATHKELPKILKKFDILINASPCGMTGYQSSIPFNKTLISKLKSTALIAEMVYNPKITPLINEVKDNNEFCEGINMLVEQAALSFYYGFGIELLESDKRIMKEAAEAALSKI